MSFTTATKVMEDGTLQELFFCHSRSVELLKAYHYILLLHCTYKTNKYRMPLLHISGITDANKTFSVVFCFMAEETETFTTGPSNAFSPYSPATRYNSPM
jgi:hypothetical protein